MRQHDVSSARKNKSLDVPEEGNNPQVFVDLSSLSVLLEQSPENPHSPEPHDFRGHPSFGGTLSFTGTSVSSESLGGVQVPRSGARVHDGGFDDAATWSAGTILSSPLGGPTCDHL